MKSLSCNRDNFILKTSFVSRFLKVQPRSALVLIDQTFVSAVNFLTGLLLARFLGIKGYGTYLLVYGVVLFFSGLHMSLIVSPMMIKGPSLSHDDKKTYYRVIVFWQTLFCIISGLLCVIAGKMIAVIMPEFGINIFLLPLTVAIIFFLTQDFIRRYFFVNERLLDVLINDFIRYGLQLFLIFFFGLRCQLDIQLTLWIIASTALCATVFAGLQLLKTRVFIFPSFQDILEIGRYHWDFGKWLLSQNMAYWMGTQLIIYMTGAILSVTAVGAMGAMRNLVGLTNIFFLSLQNIVPSRASLVFSNKGINALNKYLQKISIIGGSLTFLIIVVPLINSEFWVRLVYGTQYQGYGWIVKWWGVYFLIGFFHRPFSFGLQVLSNTRAIFFAFLAGSIVSITMTYPLLHWAGLTGGMLAACLVQIAILAVLTKSYFKVSSD